MSKFYFHILSGNTVTPDEEGMELPGVLAAEAEAVASARDIAKAGASRTPRSVMIVDDAGAFVSSVPVLSH